MEPQPPTRRRPGRRGRRGLRVLAYVAVWVVLAALGAVLLFLASTRTLTLASHDAEIRPDLSGHVHVHTGPVLPDLRLDSGSRVGVDITLGKTDATSTQQLVRRYAYIASQPDGQEAKVARALRDMAYDAALRGLALGALPVLVWVALGRARRRELVRRLPSRQGAASVAVAVAVVVGVWQPWAPDRDEETTESGQDWVPLQTFLGIAVDLPSELRDIEVLGDVTTTQTRRLIESAVDTYDKSKTFYATAADDAAGLELREPEEGETVVVLVSDRHDNIGMDAVARAIGDAGGASAVFDAGDDTSGGQAWEAFSLDSLDNAFDDLDGRWAVTGNHDNGDFVGDYLADRGWEVLDGEVVDGPAGGRLLGVPDPRSSGLGSWRDETGLSFGEVADRLADAACDAQDEGERINTLLVHDANLGKPALERGCADLVVGGHLHVQVGPTQVLGENSTVGYSFTTGTTGGAAYAIAIGSKPRRTAQVSLLTYDEDGRPAGIQGVQLQTNGVFDVGEYVPLVPGNLTDEP